MDSSLKTSRVTSVDVANLAGVSQATVSRMFNSPESVSQEKREKILAAASQLHYVPNAAARSLALNKDSNIVGIIVKDFQNPFYTHFIYSLSNKLNTIGKKVILFNGEEQNLAKVLVDAQSLNVEGLVIASSSLSQQLAVRNLPTEIPVVLINRQESSNLYCSVASDDIQSGRQAADFFVEKGIRNFAFFAGLDSTPSSRRRQNGFESRLSEWGYNNIYIIKGEYTYDSGYERMARFLSTRPKVPVGILCANDLIALGVIDAIKCDGRYKIPNDFAVIGFDNIEEGTWKSYQLSSMRMPLDEMIDTAFQYLTAGVDPLNNPYLGKHLFPCTFIQRKST